MRPASQLGGGMRETGGLGGYTSDSAIGGGGGKRGGREEVLVKQKFVALFIHFFFHSLKPVQFSDRSCVYAAGTGQGVFSQEFQTKRWSGCGGRVSNCEVTCDV